jgi:hypothetical protein
MKGGLSPLASHATLYAMAPQVTIVNFVPQEKSA